MRLSVLLVMFLLLFAMPKGPAAADDWPDQTAAVVLNRNLEMVPVKAGCYKMGDESGEGAENETPAHEVCVTDFSIGKYLVTQDQWVAVTGKNPSAHADCGASCPVENVSWNEIQEFLRKLNERTKKQYRLPTEAEWEYAARSGGKRETWAGTSNEKELGDFAWYLNNATLRSHPVGKKKPNDLGLYDMTGNVWEWMSDWYDDKYYSQSPGDNPPGPATGRQHVLRGGYWGDMAQFSRVTRRIGLAPDVKAPGYGFRVALSTQ